MLRKEVERYMDIALSEAENSKKLGFIPIGAVLLKGNIIQSAGNAEDHAEMILLKNYDCSGGVFFVTIEPCIMCIAAMSIKKIDTVYYGAPNQKFGGCGGRVNIIPFLPRKINVRGYFKKNECESLIKSFFKNKREK